MSIESVMPSTHLILCCPLLLMFSIFPSTGVFSKESVLLIRWPKYCSFSFSTNPSKEYPGLISFRIDWFDLLAVQGTDKSLFQHHIQNHQFSSAQLLYSPTLTSIRDYWKNQALTRQTFVGKVMSLLFNMLSVFVVTFLPRKKNLLSPWLQSPSPVILEPKRINSLTVSIAYQSICYELMGPDAIILVF